jgi:hypothetical protein
MEKACLRSSQESWRDSARSFNPRSPAPTSCRFPLRPPVCNLKVPRTLQGDTIPNLEQICLSEKDCCNLNCPDCSSQAPSPALGQDTDNTPCAGGFSEQSPSAQLLVLLSLQCCCSKNISNMLYVCLYSFKSTPMLSHAPCSQTIPISTGMIEIYQRPSDPSPPTPAQSLWAHHSPVTSNLRTTTVYTALLTERASLNKTPHF